MARAKIKLADNIARVVFIETDATVGSKLGQDFRMPNGELATATSLRAYIGLSGTDGEGLAHKDLSGLKVGDDHPQYTMWQARERITAQWDFTQPVRTAFGDAALPAFTFTEDADTGIYRVGADQLGATEGGVQTMRFAFANPSTLIGMTATNGTSLQPMRSDAAPAINPAIEPDWTGQHQWSEPLLGPNGSDSLPAFAFISDPDTGIYRSAANELAISTGATRRLIVDSSGRLILGHSTSIQIGSLAQLTEQISGTSSVGLSIARYSANTTGSVFAMGKSRGATVGDFTAVASGDDISRWQFAGADGTDLNSVAAAVHVTVDGAVSTGVVPGRISLFTTNTSGVSAERARLSSSGQVQVSDGAVGVPGFSFLNDTDTGLYRIGANNIGVTASGALVADFGPAVNFRVNSAQPRFQFNETDVGADLKKWEFLGSGGNWFIRTVTDADAAGENAYVITRGATTSVSSHTWRTANTDRLTLNADGQLLGSNGTNLLPAFSFISDPDTGLYRSAANTLNAAVAGTDIARFVTTGMDMYVSDGIIKKTADSGRWILCGGSANNAANGSNIRVEGIDYLGAGLGGNIELNTSANKAVKISTATSVLLLPNGAVGTPVIGFNSDTTTGLYRTSGGDIGITRSGTQVGVFNANAHLVPNGAVGTPAFSFIADPDTGLFRQAADALAVATGGAEVARFDASAVAGNTRFMIYDVDNGTLERVTVGAADSGGVGFKVLRIPN